MKIKTTTRALATISALTFVALVGCGEASTPSAEVERLSHSFALLNGHGVGRPDLGDREGELEKLLNQAKQAASNADTDEIKASATLLQARIEHELGEHSNTTADEAAAQVWAALLEAERALLTFAEATRRAESADSYTGEEQRAWFGERREALEGEKQEIEAEVSALNNQVAAFEKTLKKERLALDAMRGEESELRRQAQAASTDDRMDFVHKANEVKDKADDIETRIAKLNVELNAVKRRISDDEIKLSRVQLQLDSIAEGLKEEAGRLDAANFEFEEASEEAERHLAAASEHINAMSAAYNDVFTPAAEEAVSRYESAGQIAGRVNASGTREVANAVRGDSSLALARVKQVELDLLQAASGVLRDTDERFTLPNRSFAELAASLEARQGEIAEAAATAFEDAADRLGRLRAKEDLSGFAEALRNRAKALRGEEIEPESQAEPEPTAEG